MLEASVNEKFYLSDAILNKVNAKTGEVSNIVNGSIARTVRAGGKGSVDRHSWDIVAEPVRLGGIFDTETSKHQAGSIWDKNYLAPTVDTMQGGYRQPLITEEPKINVVGNYSPSNHDASRIVEADGLAPTVKENHGTVTAVAERFFKQAFETIEENDCSVGDTVDAFNKKINKSGVSPIITTRPEGFKTAILPVVEPLAYDEQNGYVRKDGTVGTLTTDGSSPKHNNRVVEGLRIRKLTPKECWRLMGFDDVDFDKAAAVNSNTQLYKQAGNSIVVDVLYYIFRNMIEVDNK